MALEFIDIPDQRRAPVIETPQQADKRIADFEKLKSWGLYRAVDDTYVSRTQVQRLSPGWIPPTVADDLQFFYNGRAVMIVRPSRSKSNGGWGVAKNLESATLGADLISRDWQDFIRDYATQAFVETEGLVPAFERVHYSAEQAGAMKFGNGPSADLPLSTFTVEGRPTHPPDIGYRVIIRDGFDVLQAFKISEYRKAFPLQISTGLPPVNVVPAIVLRSRALSALNDPALTIEQQLDKVREILGGKPQVIPPPAAAI